MWYQFYVRPCAAWPTLQTNALPLFSITPDSLRLRWNMFPLIFFSNWGGGVRLHQDYWIFFLLWRESNKSRNSLETTLIYVGGIVILSGSLFLHHYWTSIILASGICVLIASATVAEGRVRAASSLHEALVLNVLRSPSHFFDVTPLGRILNRFSKDVDMVDMVIPFTMTTFAQTSINTLCTVGVIGYSTPLVLAVLVPLAIIYYLIQVPAIPSCIYAECLCVWLMMHCTVCNMADALLPVQ